MMAALVSGALLGLSCGLAPGPLLALVLAQTLRHGPREGCKVAMTPLLTDAPIIIVTLAVAAKLAQLQRWLSVASFAGGAFVLYLAWDSIRPASPGAEAVATQPGSWFKGVFTNLLSPHPWLFWLTIGAAMLAKALSESWLVAAAFLFAFYLLLVGSKVLIALMAGQSRNILAGRPYRAVMRTLALLLVFFAIVLFREGLRYLGLI